MVAIGGKKTDLLNLGQTAAPCQFVAFWSSCRNFSPLGFSARTGGDFA